MKEFIREIGGVCLRFRGSILIILAVITGLIILSSLFLSYKVTQSGFCDSCHYMKPYVRHWQASSHADVDCVSCHEYGLSDLAASSLKYWTDSYNSRPKANVHDESCLASDCHDTQLLEGTIEYRNGIQFDHAKHNNGIMRGEKLRCTSCHNQIVQYDEASNGHMAVNDKSCFVCHFKDAGRGEAITGCKSCHGMPTKEVEHAGFIFDHEPYLKLDVQCKQCHIDIVKGDGAVPSAKCYSCHIERSREELSREELHETHVTINGVDCYKCHTDIEHGNFSMTSALEIACESCHLRQHNQPKQLYMGIGGRNPKDMPSEMFMAQVSCSGCHTHLTQEGEPMAHQEKKQASRQSCVKCHGENYDAMFDQWLTGSNKVLAEYGQFMKAARRDLAAIKGSKKAATKAKNALSEIEYNYNFVKEGHIPHNIQYALFLLNSSADRFAEVMTAIKRNYKLPDRGESVLVKNSCLTFCHNESFIPETVSYDDTELPHLLHVEDMELSCRSCHSESEHGKTEVQQEICTECH